MAKAIITLARLRELLEIFPENGTLRWRVNRRGPAKAGDVARSINDDGYILIRIDGRPYRAHRLIWFFATGEWPAADIDHIDGNRSNNRIENLRCATRSQNNQNQRKAHSDTTSGYLGVSWYERDRKWKATIGIDDRQRHLGYFQTPEAAHAAYLAAKHRLHPFGTI